MPSTIVYTGQRQPRAQVSTFTVTANAIGTVFTATVNAKPVTFTSTTAVVADAAAGLVAAATARTAPAEVRELAWSASGATVTVTGPADGAPFTVTPSASGGGTVGSVTTAASQSPYDAADTQNYAGGALPAAGDTLLFDPSWPDASVRYGLDTFAAVAVKVTRRPGHAGRIGLPDQAAAGYREYRTRSFATAGVTLLVAQSDQDDAQAVRLRSTAGSAVALSVSGGRAPGVGDEPVECYGLPASSVVNVAGAGLALAAEGGQTTGTLAVESSSGTLRVGPGAVLGAVIVVGGDARIEAGFATLEVDRGGSVVALGAAAASTGVTVDGGTLAWNSTGSPAVVTVGDQGAFDLTAAPGPVAVTKLVLSAGSAVTDPSGRLARPFDVEVTRCGVADVAADFGTHFKLTVGTL